jgi:hypothetical protein
MNANGLEDMRDDSVDLARVIKAVVVCKSPGCVELVMPVVRTWSLWEAGTVIVVVVVLGVNVMIEIGGNCSAFRGKLARFSLMLCTASVAWPDLVERPLNVTREF